MLSWVFSLKPNFLKCEGRSAWLQRPTVGSWAKLSNYKVPPRGPNMSLLSTDHQHKQMLWICWSGKRLTRSACLWEVCGVQSEVCPCENSGQNLIGRMKINITGSFFWHPTLHWSARVQLLADKAYHDRGVWQHLYISLHVLSEPVYVPLQERWNFRVYSVKAVYFCIY